MNRAWSKLAADYAATLRSYLAESQEAKLEQAYELGRLAIARGLGVLEIAKVHQSAVGSLLPGLAGKEEPVRVQVLSAAEAFFLEALSPFEVTHRGIQEANQRLQTLIGTLEERGLWLSQANEELQREARGRKLSEEMWKRYEAIVNTSKDLMTLIAADFRYVAVNDAYCAAHRRPREEIVGRTVAAVWGKRVFNTIIKPPLETAFTGREVHYESWFAMTGCGRHCFEVSYYPYLCGQQATHVIVVTRDITERKLAEEGLAKSELMLAEAQKLARLGSWDWDLRTNSVTWSEELYCIYGLEPRQTRGTYQAFLAYTHPQDRRRLAKTIRLAVENRRDFAAYYRVTRPDGAVRLLYAQGRVVTDASNRPVRVFVTGQDVTELKQAEEALTLSEGRLQAILDYSPAVIFLKDLAGRYLHVNREFERRFGRPRSQVVGRKDADLFPPEQAALLRANDSRVARSRGHVEYEQTARYSDGWHTTIVSKFPLLDSKRQVYALCCIATDITIRKRAEEALRQSEERFRLLVSSVEDYAIMMLDPAGRVASWNLGAERIHGYTAEEIIGRHFSCFYPSEEAQTGKPERQLRIATRKGHCEEESWRARNDGSRFWASVLIYAVRDGFGRLRGFAKVTRDMTKRKQAELALRESEEHFRQLFNEATVMQENLRRLSDKVLHVQEEERARISRELHDEVGQALTAVNMGLELLKRQDSPAPADFCKRLADSQALLAQTMATVHGFARELRPAMLDDLGLVPALNSYIRGFTERTNLPVRFTADMKDTKLDGETSIVIYRVTQESLTNVAKHAKATQAQVSLRRHDGRIHLEIQDNGRAFRTNGGRNHQPAQGGLGLLGMRERVRLVKGDFSVSSQPGKGTTIRVELPIGGA